MSCEEGFGSLRLIPKYYRLMTSVIHHFLDRGLFVLFLFGLWVVDWLRYLVPERRQCSFLFRHDSFNDIYIHFHLESVFAFVLGVCWCVYLYICYWISSISRSENQPFFIIVLTWSARFVALNLLNSVHIFIILFLYPLFYMVASEITV